MEEVIKLYITRPVYNKVKNQSIHGRLCVCVCAIQHYPYNITDEDLTVAGKHADCGASA
jgi:hypothetical protein